MSLSSPDNLTTAGLYYEFNTDLIREALTLLFLGEGGSQCPPPSLAKSAPVHSELHFE